MIVRSSINRNSRANRGNPIGGVIVKGGNNPAGQRLDDNKPIVIDVKAYSNIDGNNADEVKDFQRYAISKGVNLDYISKSTGLLVSGENSIDGIYAAVTKAAYKIHGADWEKTRPAKDKPKEEVKKEETKKEETKKDEVTVTKDANGNTITVTKKADGTTTTVITDKNGKVISKKESGLSENLKIGLIIGGGILVFGLVIFALSRKRQRQSINIKIKK